MIELISGIAVGRGARTAGTISVLCVAALSTLGCTGEDDELPLSAESSIEAVEIWAHPDSVGMEVFQPLDLKAASRDVVWAIDGVGRAVVRYEPAAGAYGVFGFRDSPPPEVVRPARLAIAGQSGVFVFDESTGMVDLYSPGGQHLRGFDPGIRPSILEVSEHPLRLTYGVGSFVDDTVPTLTVIQTDFLGEHPDTLLAPDIGPESLRRAPAVPGELVSAPATSGLWVLSTAYPDTVFELVGAGSARKLVLPEADTLRVGILADLQQEILWVVAPRPAGGLDYEAYDISGPGIEGIIDGGDAYLGVRTTPLGFTGIVAFDGSVAGWWLGDRGSYAPRGYDMRLDDLRQGAITARALRPVRRAEFEDAWTRALAAADSARRAAAAEAVSDTAAAAAEE